MINNLEIKNIIQYFHFRSEISEHDLETLICHVLKIEKKELILNPKKNATNQEFQTLIDHVNLMKNHDFPLNYILKYKYFFDKKFKINKHTLIPRPETEELVKMLSDEKNIEKNSTILDIGTGSGVIAISLKIFRPDLKIIATDISKKALKVAKKNTKIHLKNSYSKIKFFKSDLLRNKIFQKKYRNSLKYIVANLPYIPKKKYFALDKNIFYEPRKSLVSGKHGLKLIKKLIFQTKKLKFQNLKKIFLEIDESKNHISELKKFTSKMKIKIKVKIKKDIFQMPRFAILTLDQKNQNQNSE